MGFFNADVKRHAEPQGHSWDNVRRVRQLPLGSCGELNVEQHGCLNENCLATLRASSERQRPRRQGGFFTIEARLR